MLTLRDDIVCSSRSCFGGIDFNIRNYGKRVSQELFTILWRLLPTIMLRHINLCSDVCNSSIEFDCATNCVTIISSDACIEAEVSPRYSTGAAWKFWCLASVLPRLVVTASALPQSSYTMTRSCMYLLLYLGPRHWRQKVKYVTKPSSNDHSFFFISVFQTIQLQEASASAFLEDKRKRN